MSALVPLPMSRDDAGVWSLVSAGEGWHRGIRVIEPPGAEGRTVRSVWVGGAPEGKILYTLPVRCVDAALGLYAWSPCFVRPGDRLYVNAPTASEVFWVVDRDPEER